ncbi:hypothetical protein [Idiomarina aminovorans]|uniref:hypothetical protein n=1 Tax=Idiomarina aminovorans TaxID=2914829 RepID=UPI002002C3C5|nr:hypothetical protein [Idiomarina sp. ATCH4]MCK7459455.1 hypothetical protein [Idiomarina sp. ATCH4]
MTKERIVMFSIAIFFFIATEIMRTLYRPWVYSDGVNDYGVADSVGSFGGAFVIVFGLTPVLSRTPKKARGNSIALAMSCVIYEVLQPHLGTGVFDWLDLIAAAIGGSIAALSVGFWHHKVDLRNA